MNVSSTNMQTGTELVLEHDQKPERRTGVVAQTARDGHIRAVGGGGRMKEEVYRISARESLSTADAIKIACKYASG